MKVMKVSGEVNFEHLGMVPLSILRASPGPWWGFNGIDTLAVVANGVWRFHRTFTVFPWVKKYKRMLFPFGQVQVISRKRNTLRLLLGDRKRLFTAKNDNGVDSFIAALERSQT